MMRWRGMAELRSELQRLPGSQSTALARTESVIDAEVIDGVVVAEAPASPLLEVDELASLLRISRWSIYRWARDGRIPSVRCGRKLRFVFDDVVQALKDPGRTEPLPSYVAPRQPIACRKVAAPRPEKPADPAERLRAATDLTKALRDG